MLTLSVLKITTIHKDLQRWVTKGKGRGEWCLEMRAEKYLYSLFLSEIREGETNNNSKFSKLIPLRLRSIRYWIWHFHMFSLNFHNCVKQIIFPYYYKVRCRQELNFFLKKSTLLQEVWIYFHYIFTSLQDLSNYIYFPGRETEAAIVFHSNGKGFLLRAPEHWVWRSSRPYCWKIDCKLRYYGSCLLLYVFLEDSLNQ